MSRILECEFCGNVNNAHGVRQAELYDGIAEVMMCWKCEPAARFERERIIKLLEGIETYPPDWDYDDQIGCVIALIKGENK